MEIEIRGIPGDPALQAHVRVQLTRTLERLSTKPTAADIGFTDENGPKGGVDIRCALTLHVPRRRTLHVDHVAETARLAFDGGFERLERQLGRERARARVQRRRPKKYYMAKRLREGGPGQLEPPRAETG
jgi:ribosome-associated translation inhibitor RaiA